MNQTRTAILYRMVLPDQTCPFGVRARDLLIRSGYRVEDNILRSREQVEAFKQDHGVATTPQVFMEGERIGGSDELEALLSEA